MCLAIPGQVVSVVDEANRLAEVEVAGVRRRVNVGLLDREGDGAGRGDGEAAGSSGGDAAAVCPGDWVLIHVGFAISRVDAAEARATLELLEGMGQDYRDELAEIRGSAIE